MRFEQRQNRLGRAVQGSEIHHVSALELCLKFAEKLFHLGAVHFGQRRQRVFVEILFDPILRRADSLLQRVGIKLKFLRRGGDCQRQGNSENRGNFMRATYHPQSLLPSAHCATGFARAHLDTAPGARLCRRPAAAASIHPRRGKQSRPLIHLTCCGWSRRHSRAPLGGRRQCQDAPISRAQRWPGCRWPTAKP